MVVSRGSSRAKWVSTRRRSKGSAMSAVVGAGLLWDFASLAAGGRVALWAGGWCGARRPGALPGQPQPGGSQGGEAAPLAGVGVGGRQVAALEERGDGFRIFAVALGLAAMHGGHGPGVAEDEGDGVIAAGVGEPVPAMHTLAGDEEPGSEGSDGAAARRGSARPVFCTA